MPRSSNNSRLQATTGTATWVNLLLTPLAVALAESNTRVLLNAIWGASKDDIYIAGHRGTILRSIDSGKTWTSQTTNTTNDILAIWGSGAGDIYAVGSKGLILHSSDKGKTWQKQESGVTLSLTSLWGSSANDIYIGAAFGILFHSTNHGETWQKIDTNNHGTIFSLWGSGADDVYAAGGGPKGMVLHSTDQGKTWSAQTLGENYLGSVFGFSKNDVWLSGDKVYRSRDQGKTWAVVPTIPEAPVLYLWGLSPEEIYTVGPRNTIIALSCKAHLKGAQNSQKC